LLEELFHVLEASQLLFLLSHPHANQQKIDKNILKGITLTCYLFQINWTTVNIVGVIVKSFY
jgi:hypothetical protein